MLLFYRSPDCPQCSHIEETLKELTIAHRVVLIQNKGEDGEKLPKGAKLPLLQDEAEVFVGIDDILKRLTELEKFKELWDTFQSDACYCDEDGEMV